MDILPLLFFFVIIIPSAIFHEYMHGWMADQLGDPTARYAGRLSLNPIVHIDKWGTLFLPVALFMLTSGQFLFAYAKPVPFNPFNLKDQKWGPAWVAIAGPMANFIIAAVFGAFIQFGLMPALFPFLYIITYANVLLGVFNLVPIPPLDGSKILYALLPDSMSHIKQKLDQYGFVVLLVFIFFFSHWISPIIQFITEMLTGGYTWF